MLKHPIKYTDFNDEEQTEEFYFNINKTEILDLEVEHKEGLEQWVKNVVAAKDQKVLWNEIKRVVLLAYGEKSPDGKRFIKTPQIAEEFAQTAAFDALMWSFVSDADAAATFMQSVMPKDLASEVDIAEAKKKAQETLGITPAPEVTPPNS
jgi:hypothetical protein